MQLTLPNEQSTLDFAAQMAGVCPAQLVIFLQGNLGAGKTTFARGFLRALGHQGTVKSPTYTLVETYTLGDKTIFHFDLYRIKDTQELEFIGIQDYFAQKAISLIEWPENGEGLLPPADLSCYIEPDNSGRQVKLVAHSKQGKDVLERLTHAK